MSTAGVRSSPAPTDSPPRVRDNIILDDPEPFEEHIIRHLERWGLEKRTVFVFAVNPAQDEPELFEATGYEAETGNLVVFPLTTKDAEHVIGLLGLESAEQTWGGEGGDDAEAKVAVRVHPVNPALLCPLDHVKRRVLPQEEENDG